MAKLLIFNKFFSLSFLILLTSFSTGQSRKEMIDRQVENQYGKIISNTSDAKMVEELGKNVARWAYNTDYNFTFKLIDNDEPNAFAFSDGSVYVLKGLFKTTESENEIAFVIAHEIAHIILKHNEKQINYKEKLNLKNNDSRLREFSREQEYEADKYGILYSIHAGYSPLSSVNWFNRMTSLGYEYPPLYVDYTDHPNFTQRVVQAFIHIGTYYEYAKNFDYGLLYLSMGNYYEAVDAFMKFLDKYPHYKEAYNNIGVALLSEKLQSKKTSSDLWEPLAISKIQLFNNNFDKPVRGSYNFVTRDFSEAIEYFEEAIQYDDKYPMPYINLALINIYTKNYNKAKDYIDKALKLDKISYEAQITLGVLFAEQNQFDEASECFQKAININNINPQGYFNLAYSYQWNNKKDLALKTWKKFVELMPSGKYYDKAIENIELIEDKDQKDKTVQADKNDREREIKKEKSKPSPQRIAGIMIGDEMIKVKEIINSPDLQLKKQSGVIWEYTNPSISIGFNSEGIVNYIIVFDSLKNRNEFLTNINIGSLASIVKEQFGNPSEIFIEGIYTVFNYPLMGLTFWIADEKVSRIGIYKIDENLDE